MVFKNPMINVQLNSNAEHRFFDLVRCSDVPELLLQRFSIQYHYFSLCQVHAFCGIFRVLGPEDRRVAALLAEVIYEELGEGDANKIHSVLLEQFLEEIGIDISSLPIPRNEVVKGVREYVDALYSAFWGNDLSEALATYCFLENSAVETYPALVELLSDCGVSNDRLEFFHLHSSLEVEHAAAAARLVDSLVIRSEEVERFNTQFSSMNNIWNHFWNDIAAYAVK
jgi:hypothetical protein